MNIKSYEDIPIVAREMIEELMDKIEDWQN